MSPYKLQKSLETGNFGTDHAAKRGPGGMWGGGGVMGEGCGRSACGACLSTEGSKRGRVSRAV